MPLDEIAVTDKKVLNHGIDCLFGFPLALSGSELSQPASFARSRTRESGIAPQSVEFFEVASGFRRHAKTPCAELRACLAASHRWTAESAVMRLGILGCLLFGRCRFAACAAQLVIGHDLHRLPIH
jgi:hypothetical protein